MRIPCSVFLVFGAMSATAEGASDERLVEEVIVVEDRLQQRVRDTPAAVTALSHQRIEDFGLTDPDDLTLYMPSFTRDNFNVTIRGVGRNFMSTGGDPGVAGYMNGVYSPEVMNFATENRYYDVQRIEVQRGPQGTLNGRGVAGGSVNIVTNPPTNEFFAETRVVGGAHNRGDFYGVLSGPLIDGVLKARLVGVSAQQGGDRPSRAVPGLEPIGDTGRVEDHNVALTLDWTPSDYFDATLRFNRRYARTTPRHPLLIGEGIDNRDQRSSAPCFPEGVDCFNESLGFHAIPALNPNAHQNLPVSGNGYGEDLDNVAYPDFKPDYGLKVRQFMLDARLYLWEDRATLRYLGAHNRLRAWLDGVWLSSAGGRNRCMPPRCTPGLGPGSVPITQDRLDTVEDYRPLTSHELQLVTNLDGPLTVVGGLFFFRSVNITPFKGRDPAHLGTYTRTPSYGELGLVPDGPGPGPHNIAINAPAEVFLFGGTSYGTWNEVIAQSDVLNYAVYGRVRYEINERWSASVGLRWSRDEKEGHERRWNYVDVDLGTPLAQLNQQLTTDPQTGQYNGDPLRLAGLPLEILGGLELADSWERLSWHLGIDWKPGPSSLVYGSLTRGFRSGGFNLVGSNPLPYDDEEILAYELGWKASDPDGRGFVSAAAYFYDYDDHQVESYQDVAGAEFCQNVLCPEGTDFVATALLTTRNVPTATNWGIELEGQWNATPQLKLGAMYSYMRTEITSDFFVSTENNPWRRNDVIEQVNTRGNDLNRSPRDKLTFWGNYTLPLGDRGRINFFGAYAYMGERYYDVLNYRINQAPAYHRWDARATWDSPTGRYRIAAFVKNIANELGIVEMRFGFNNFTRIADTTPPRAWGLEFRVRFGNWHQRDVEIMDDARVM